MKKNKTYRERGLRAVDKDILNFVRIGGGAIADYGQMKEERENKGQQAGKVRGQHDGEVNR